MGAKSEDLDGADAGEWIAERLSAYRGVSGGRSPAAAVGGTVPDCFEAYVRIFHAASWPDGSRAGWRDVAAAQGTVWHPEMQFNAIAGPAHRHPGADLFGDLGGLGTGQRRQQHVQRHLPGAGAGCGRASADAGAAGFYRA
ncbi:hypothetical protein IV498_06035 [Paenarthrobacter sp. Z7-10]|uniref:hypothetical protein n=1 Tax=Paenarthrobacter sp. Z7-10 TaxID=2787635 RepID=UPI0022A9BE18|nr:hypothetical protein [Paenarthrobacter sp. Z7-10]MCZ2402755.1 hypothetical protein [Paenarthrobacter sp. Z7-10]